VVKKGAVEIIKRTVLAGLYAAVALPATVYKTATMTLDNEFQRTKDKATQAGILLAEVLVKRVQGTRPVTLIGSSLGAVTIFTCLQELRKQGQHDLVYNVVLIGAPLSATKAEWAAAKSMVAHKFVNVYSTEDWVLAIVARLHSLISTRLSVKIAGLQPVEAQDIDDVNVSEIIDGHLELNSKMPEVLQSLDPTVLQ